MPELSPSVLIIRLDAIGDALALTPLLAALRSRGIPVDVVLRESNAGIFAPQALRRSIIARFQLRSSSHSNRSEIEALGQSLRANAYSHTLVATEDPSGYRLAQAVAAPVRIGFVNGWGKPIKTLWSRRLLTGTVYRSADLDPAAPHECEVLFRLAASLIGDEKPSRDAAKLRPLVLESEPVPDDRITIQITETWQRLGIPASDVVELVRRVAANGPLQLVSAQREERYAQRIAESTRLRVVRFNDLAQWKAAIGAAAALVAPDSGAMHVAGMVGTPVVGIFPPGRNYPLQVARWAPWAAPHRTIRADDGWAVRAADALRTLLSA
jgi:ADP-heptose:LPS heptosyltransferase